jgi:Phage integrase protein
VPTGFRGADALRAWYAGLAVREAVARYLPARLGEGRSARGVLGRIRRQLIAFARHVHRDAPGAAERHGRAKAAAEAIEAIRHARAPAPHIGDDIGAWLPARAAAALRCAHGIDTLAELTVRIPRRRQWWRAVPGLSVASARRFETFFATHPTLTERALIAERPRSAIVP